MGYFNVVRPCVVGKLHYARPTTQPIEVDDEVAAPLVAEGNLELYLPAAPPPVEDDEHSGAEDQEAEPSESAEPDPEPKPSAPRRGRVRRSPEGS